MRGFVFIWTGITVLMGACTFIAIYAAYGAFNPPTPGARQNNIALPIATQETVVAAVATMLPTQPPTALPPTAAPTQVAQAQADQAATATPVPASPEPTQTPLPVSVTRFEPGIQVQFSIDMNPDNQDGWLRDVKQKMGLNWFKQQVRWADTELERGVYDWSKLDLVMPSAQRFGLNVMITVLDTPVWAREPGVDLTKVGPPANYDDYVNFVLQIFERYPNQIQGIEVWNEQNIDREWSSSRGLRAVDYIDLLRRTYRAVKEVSPGTIVVSGALAPTGFNDGIGAWDDFVYMDQMIEAGLLDVSDCVGAHHNGYNIGPSVPSDQVPSDPTASFRGPFDNPHHSWSFYSTLRTYASKIAAAGGTQKLCVTEFGWAVSEDLGGFPVGFEFAQDNTLQEQADYIIEALNLMEEWGTVRLAFIWNFNYAPQAGWAIDNDNVPYSLIGPNFVFRPAYDAIIAWSAERRARGIQ
jgi:hypothetical protein